MKIKNTLITDALLREHDACDEARAIFNGRYPRGLRIKTAADIAHALRFGGMGHWIEWLDTLGVVPNNAIKADDIWIDLSGFEFAGAALTKSDFDNINFSGCNFYNAQAYDASFWRCNLDKTKWLYAHLFGFCMKQCKATGMDFHQAMATYSCFQYSELIKPNFYGTDLRNAGFHECKLTKANFGNAGLQNASFENSELKECEFRSNWQTNKLCFNECELHNCDFRHAIFDGTIFKNCAITEAHTKFIPDNVKFKIPDNVKFKNCDFTDTQMDQMSWDFFSERSTDSKNFPKKATLNLEKKVRAKRVKMEL